LIFIYSGDGETSGKESVPNKYFFTKLAESLVKTISSHLGEGMVFRIDLRLRPRGREGDLVVSLAEMLRYYRNEAQNWERQALIRARSSAGNNALVEKLLAQLRDQIYKPEPLIDALKSVKQTKEKIDSDVAKRSGGYNVKLGKGGIREIEFIVQALQICYGGQDPWLCAPQTLIGLQRLTDKNLLSDNEHTQLAQAYVFLRMVEHRLQMEHGLQTHSLPTSEEKLFLLARRCGQETYKSFEEKLLTHSQNVQNVYNRVFGQTEIKPSNKFKALSQSVLNISRQTQKNLVAPIANIESLFQEALIELANLPNLKEEQTEIAKAIALGLESSINPARALRKLKDFSLSLRAEDEKNQQLLSLKQIEELTIIASNSQYFFQMLISHPSLCSFLGEPLDKLEDFTNKEYFYQKFSQALENLSFEQASIKLRALWNQELLKLGRYDLLSPKLNIKDSLKLLRKINIAQSALAEASLEIASKFASEELLNKLSPTENPIIYAILGLGRLGHSGIDYNSDLDIVFVYLDKGNVVTEITNQEFFAKLITLIVQMLSSLKREGMLYRVDLRLRPDGKNGVLATSFEKLQTYLEERAAIWELLAYLKARSVAGDIDFCAKVETRILELLFSRSAKDFSSLSKEIKDIRLRLQNQKGNANDFKFGIGGMLDVYFATRYLQLKHQIPDPKNRGTLSLIADLAEKKILTEKQANILEKGYTFLRQLDHKIRLQLERPQTQLPHNLSQRLEIAKELGYEDEASFLKDYKYYLQIIREVYEEII
jgi:glutamate-ammonia-ligase adenylyltransferase